MSRWRGRSTGRWPAAMLAALAVAVVPSIALACAVCGGGNPANRFAFFASTVSLSLLPLGLFVAAFLWLKPRILRHAGDEFRERDATTRDTTRP